MATEHFIEGRKQGEHHAGRRSHRQRLESAMQSISDWRRQATEAHLAGHAVDREIIPQDEEVILFERSFKVPSGAIFEMPEVKKMMEDNREPLDRGNFDSDGNKL